MSVIRLRVVGPQSATLTSDATTSSVTLYTFLKSCPTSSDRAMALRELQRSCARYEERETNNSSGGGGGLSFLQRGNAHMVSICEDVMHRLVVSQDVEGRRSASHSERNPSLAAERGLWKRFLTSPPASRGDEDSTWDNNAREARQASTTSTNPTSLELLASQRILMSEQAAAVHTKSNVSGAQHDKTVSRTEQTAAEARIAHMDERKAQLVTPPADTPQPPSTSSSLKSVTVVSSPQPTGPRSVAPSTVLPTTTTSVSPPRRIQEQSNHQPHAFIRSMLASVVQAYRTDPANTEHPDDLAERHAQMRLDSKISAMRTSLMAYQDKLRREKKDERLNTNAHVNTTNSNSLAQREALTRQLETRVDNLVSFRQVQQHEQDTLDLTANALRIENAAMTRMLRQILTVMLRAEVSLEGTNHPWKGGSVVPDGAALSLLYEIRSILDSAAGEEEEGEES